MRAREGITDAVGRPDDRSLLVVAQRATQLLYQSDERRVRHERIRPEARVYLALRNNGRCVFDQQSQQVESFRRQMNLSAIAQQLTAIRMKSEGAETLAHD